MDQLDFRYKDLREQLYSLGFHQQLPIGSMSIVSALLDDLIKVTDSYKKSKESVKNLLEEKKAWELGIEPYKCDNSRLLSENNELHLELIKIRGHYDKKIFDQNNTIRNLEVDKNYLDDHCFELVSKIREMEHQPGKGAKAAGSRKVLHKKPFISAVRGDHPRYPTSPTAKNPTSARLCAGKSSNDPHVEVVKLQNDIQLLTDETNSLKKQLEGRDREISRLHQQFTGGRPVAALGRDCCYRGIDTLTEDMKVLQQQLITTKKQLEESLKQQHEAKLRAIKLEEEKVKFARDLKDMEVIALKVQDEANKKVMDKEKQYDQMVDKLNESLRKNATLEASANKSSTSSQTKVVESMKAALKKANDENDNLIEKLINDEQQYKEEIKLLTRKNSKLEEKLDVLQSKVSNEKSQKRLYSKGTLTDPQSDPAISKEKILLQTEYLRRLNQPAYERELENVQSELVRREIEIDNLKALLSSQPQNKPVTCSHTSISVQSAMSRMEREAESLKSKIEHMNVERDDLKQNLKEIIDDYHNEQISGAAQILALSNQIKQLEDDKRSLRDSHRTGTSNENKIIRMTEEIESYIQQLEELNSENCKLKTSYTKIKTLQEQTEKSLLDYQNRLFQLENELAQTACVQGAMDAKFEFTNKTINNLKAEASKLKSIIEELEKDRSEMHNQLDVKTEQMCQMDIEISRLRSEMADLSSKSLTLRRQMSSKSHESVEKTNTIHKVTQETEVLRKQNEHLKALNENLTTENSRLSLQINDLTCACKELKKKQGLSDAEVNRLKASIKDYVEKIQVVEDTLAMKTVECERMLDNFNEFESGAKVLERTNHSLEIENEEANRRLTDAEVKLQHLQEILNERDNEIAANYRQSTELSNQLTDIERELKRREEEIELQQANSKAIKELCSKLDIEKEKLNEELNECSKIRRKLEQENEKLRKDLTAGETLDQQGAVQKLQELLTASKGELEQQRATISEKSTEIQKLRTKINELKEKYEEEKENSKRYQALSQENAVQIQELDRKLTNYRYEAKVSKDQMQKDEYDRNNFLNEQSPTRGDIIDTNSSNSNNSRNLKSSKSNIGVKAGVTKYKRVPLSVFNKPTMPIRKRKFMDQGYSETSVELSSTMDSYFSKTPNSTEKSSQSRKERKERKERNGKHRLIKSKTSSIEESTETSEKVLFQNNLNVESAKSYNQRTKPSGVTQLTFEKRKSFLETPPRMQVSLEEKQKNQSIPTLQEKSTLLNDESLSSESREFFTCNSSSTLPPLDKPLKTTAKESKFDVSVLPPPPPTEHQFTCYSSDQTIEFTTQLVSHIGTIQRFRGNYVISSNK